MTKIAKLAEILRERILSGEWGNTQFLPNRMMLSEEYGVAPGTISQAFRNLEMEGLVRILPRKGVMISDPEDPSVSKVETKAAIGVRGSYLRLGVPGNDGYSGHIVNQLLDASQKRGVPLMILQKNAEETPFTRDACERMGLRGMIYLGGDCGDEARSLCLEGFPVISGNRSPERSPVNYVDCDHVALIRDMVRRFTQAGHRRIAVLLRPTHVPGLLEKLRPHFIETLLTNGIQYDILPYWVSLVEKGMDDKSVAPIDALFSLPEPPTAFLCWNELILEQLLSVVSRRGLSVPHDISAVYATSNPAAFPQISGYSFGQQDFGGKLLDGLIANIEDPFFFIQDELTFDYIDRGSIAPVSPHSASD